MPTIIRTPMIDDDGSGTTGTILNNAWKQELYGQIDALAAAQWIAPPFVASDYFVNIGTGAWPVAAGDVVNTSYCIIGRTLFWNFSYNASVGVTGAPIALSRKPFGNYQIARVSSGVFLHTLTSVGYYQTNTGAASQINFFRDINGGVAWPTSAPIKAQGFYEIA